jgi:hypothetical protein
MDGPRKYPACCTVSDIIQMIVRMLGENQQSSASYGPDKPAIKHALKGVVKRVFASVARK